MRAIGFGLVILGSLVELATWLGGGIPTAAMWIMIGVGLFLIGLESRRRGSTRFAAAMALAAVGLGAVLLGLWIAG